jgi:hypothetical protein
VAEREASGEFNYLIGDLPDADESDGLDHSSAGDHHTDEQDGRLWISEPESAGSGSFDAFDDSTWYFEPAPVPWYQRKQALTALIATVVAAVAIVVSGVLLVFRGPSSSSDVESTTPVTATAPSTVASPSPSSPEPPPPPPPPPETSAAPAPPPAQTYQPQTPRSTKEPEIGVTRTPVTRSQLSVAPQRPGGRSTSR